MVNKIVIFPSYNFAVKRDNSEKRLLLYSYVDGNINYSSEGLLLEVNKEVFQKIETEMNIKLEDYGVVLKEDIETFSEAFHEDN